MPTQSSAAPTVLPPHPGRLTPPPGRAGLVPRTRLLQRLVSAADTPVFVVHAPAGYGKSTFLAQYAENESRPVAWLSLDQVDDDATVLLYDLACAVAGPEPPDEDLLARLLAGPAGVLPVALPRLIGLLHARTEPLVIVLDDVHVLQSTAARAVVRSLCEDAPPGCTIVLSGRQRPALPLARMRAAGRLAEIRAADLRMTTGEGAGMLRAAGVDVDEREAAIVVRQTEGWPAAVYLAALMLRADDRPSDGAAWRFHEGDVAEYVRDEVLADASHDDVEFLVRSSILDELRPDVCDDVLEGEESRARLAALADADLFVTPAEAHGGAYRVHPLFREVLQAELRARGDGEDRRLHRRASEAYLERGDGERAVAHAIAAGDAERAADLIFVLSPEAITHGRTGTVRRWVALLGAEGGPAHPVAAVAEGWAALEEGDADRAADCAALVLGGDPARLLLEGSTLEAMGLVLRGTVGLQGIARTVADLTRAEPEIGAGSPVLVIARHVLGALAMLNDDRERARALLEDAEHGAAGALPTAYGLVLAHQALLAIEEGRWDLADALLRRARAQQRAAGVQEYASQGIVQATRALVLAQRGEREPARKDAAQALLNLARLRFIVPWLGVETRLVLADAFARLGDGRKARALLDECAAQLELDPAPFLTRWRDRVEDEIERIDGRRAEGGPDLTTAELRTLQYLPTHLSLREVGERLYITRNTVKTHTVSIYRKLEVGSRSEAVARSRELGLLE